MPSTDIGPLVVTRWKQRDDYALYTPDNQRLGCWSVAFGQILFHHRLAPTGSQSYTGTNYTVSTDFSAPSVDLNMVVPQILPATPDPSKQATARYLWYAACVMQKDFGTGNYMDNSDVRRAEAEAHYPVTTERVRTPGNTRAEVVSFIRTELGAGRPLLLYVEGNVPGDEGLGHAIVIDGIRGGGDSVSVHLNFGWEGVSDGWYALWETIVSAYGTFDIPDRWVLAVRPD